MRGFSRTKKKCDGLVNNAKEMKSRQFSFSDEENATKPRNSLKLFQINDKQIEATLVKQFSWHDLQTTTTQKVIPLFSTGDRAIRFDKASVN